MREVDTRGLSCPEPIMLTQEATIAGDSELAILVDTEVSKENVIRFLENAGYKTNLENAGDHYRIVGSK